MGKNVEKLNINKERAMLSIPGKQTWDAIFQEINALYEEQKINTQQREDLMQRKMAAVRATDMKAENEELKKSNDLLAKRKINKNIIKISDMEKVYQANAQKVKDTEPLLDERIVAITKKIAQEKQSKKANNK